MFSAKSTYFTAITASPDPSPTPTSSATPTPTPTPTLTPTPTPTVVAPAPAAPVLPAPVAANVPTASVKVKSVTSVKWPSAKIKPGSTSVTGRVIPAQTGIAVSLQVLRSGTWATVATDTTGAKGVWKTSWNDVNAGSYKMRIVAASKLNSVVTSSRTLTAVGAVTILGPGKVNRNSTISIRGAVSPGLSGIQVTIQRRIGSGSWRNVGTVSTNSSGSWSASFPAGANKTSNQFRVTTSDGRIGQSTSKTLTTSIR
jgi:5-hydroxyisourate hydrolase-like protein (transthyretin family)